MVDTFLDAYPDVVHTSGRNVAGQTDGAQGCASGFLTALETAAADVVHATVADALESFRNDWVGPAMMFVAEVEALGINTSTCAIEVTAADAQAGDSLASTVNHEWKPPSVIQATSNGTLSYTV